MSKAVPAARQLGPFQERVFLAGTEIDQNDRLDGQGPPHSISFSAIPALGTQAKVSRTERHIHQRSFHRSTNPVDAAEYLQEEMSQAYHVLDFDHKEIGIEGSRSIHPNSKEAAGASSHFQKTKQGLVAVATQNRRTPGLLWHKNRTSRRWSVK
jgi:hypothetical protein